MKIHYFFIFSFFLFSACHTAEKLVEKPVEKAPDLSTLGDSAYFYGKIAGKTVFLKEGRDFSSSQTFLYFSPAPLDSALFTQASMYPKDIAKIGLNISVSLYRPHRLKQSFPTFRDYFQIGKPFIRQNTPNTFPHYEIFISYIENGKQYRGLVYGDKAELEVLEVESMDRTRYVPDMRVKFRIKGSMWSYVVADKGRYLGEMEGIYQAHFRYYYTDIDELLKKLNGGK